MEPCSSMRSQGDYGRLVCAGAEHSSCTDRPSSVCAENPFSRRTGGCSLAWLALLAVDEPSRVESVNSHPEWKSTMNRGGGEVWNRFSSWSEHDPGVIQESAHPIEEPSGCRRPSPRCSSSRTEIGPLSCKGKFSENACGGVERWEYKHQMR